MDEDIWKQRFEDWAIQTARSVKPSRRLNNDSMCFSEYVRIKKIDHFDDSKCMLVYGAVISNNIADKRMKSYLVNPRILILANSLTPNVEAQD